MSLREKNKIELNGLIQTVEKIMNRRDKSYLKALRVSKDQQSVTVICCIIFPLILL